MLLFFKLGVSNTGKILDQWLMSFKQISVAGNILFLMFEKRAIHVYCIFLKLNMLLFNRIYYLYLVSCLHIWK